MTRRAFWGVLLLLACVNLAIFGWYSIRARPGHPEPLEIGDLAPRIEGQGILDGDSVVLRPGRWSLILYLAEDSAANQRRLVAAQELAERFGKDGLEIAALAPRRFPGIVELVERNAVRFPVIHDTDGTLLRGLRLPHPSDTLFLLDRERRVRFQSIHGSYGATELQFLAEKHVAGRISYPEDMPGVRIAVGQRLPGTLGFRDLASGKALSPERLSPDPELTLVFFTSDCSTCSLAPSMAIFGELQRRIAATGGRAVPVFSPLFSPIEVAGHAADLGIVPPLLTTEEAGIRFVDPGEEGGGSDAEVTIVALGEDGAVRSIRPLDDGSREVTR